MELLHELAQSVRDTGKITAGAEDAHYGFLGWGQYGHSCQQIAGGFFEDEEVAMDLATMEAVERYCLEEYRSNLVGGKQDLRGKGLNFLSFDALVPLSDWQLKKANLCKLSDGELIDWHLGKDCAGREVYIPSELVFYGLNTPGKFHRATSSGAAARGTINEAIISGLEELIERDALMKTWLRRYPPRKVADNLLPEWVREVKKRLQSEDRDLLVLDLTDVSFGMVPVFLSVIVSSKYPFFVSGSAAGFGSHTTTMKKAVTEASHSLAHWSRVGRNPWRWNKSTPSFHGAYYASKKHLGINWLFEGPKSKNIWTEYSYDPNNFERALKKYDAVYTDISVDAFPTVKVAKVFSPLLIPISFGAGMVHYKKATCYNVLSLLAPHCFM